MAYCENLFAEDFGGGRRRDHSTSLSKDGEVISSHFFEQSAFATYASMVEESVIKIDSDVPLEHLGPLGCGLNIGARTVLKELHPPAGSSIIVFGTRAVGNAAVMAAGVAGCTMIIAVDIVDSRLEMTKELSATHPTNAETEDVTARITGGRGVDFAVDTTARVEILRTASEALGVRGTLGLVGAAKPGAEVNFEIGNSLVKGWTFKTVVQDSSVPQVFIPHLIDLWREGKFPFEKLIGEYDLEHINDGFEGPRNGSAIKPVVVFH